MDIEAGIAPAQELFDPLLAGPFLLEEELQNVVAKRVIGVRQMLFGSRSAAQPFEPLRDFRREMSFANIVSVSVLSAADIHSGITKSSTIDTAS